MEQGIMSSLTVKQVTSLGANQRRFVWSSDHPEKSSFPTYQVLYSWHLILEP